MFVAPNLPKGKVIDSPAEMLSVYPTLLELCGLPAYDRNEGHSLVSTMQNTEPEEGAFALTTYGMNNHAIRSDRFRYIQYEDSTEEFYDHNNDPNEFTNQTNNAEYKGDIDVLKKYLPKTNANWDKYSSYTFQPYWVEQKAKTSGSDSETAEVIGAGH
jgi:arylsulfatase A-like enzyme